VFDEQAGAQFLFQLSLVQMLYCPIKKIKLFVYNAAFASHLLTKEKRIRMISISITRRTIALFEHQLF
jgi:hypothetical protein